MSRFRLLVIGVLLSLMGAVLPASALGASTTVTVHYQRFDADYAGWNLWMWAEGKDGDGYAFTGQDDFGVTGTFSVPNTGAANWIGIIVRLSKSGSDWASKDYEKDRQITQFKADGSAEIWLVQDTAEIFYSKPVLAPQIKAAAIDDVRSIGVALNSRFAPVAGANDFVITGPDAPAITKVTTSTGAPTGLSLILTTATDLALDGAYTVTHPKYGSASVTLGKVLGSATFDALYTYTGDDLGNTYTPTATRFRLWAPTASAAMLVVYPTPDKSLPTEVPMSKDLKGTWVATLAGDRHGTIYTYRVRLGGEWNEAVDPYVRAATLNGGRGVVVDLSRTNPAKWTDERPAFTGNATDAVIYELHVRDLSMDADSGISAGHRGKFLALTEHGTKTPDGKTATGVDAIRELGVTHLQLLPVYDYKTVDESRNDQFNWGYDPLNYNVPEGSYATDPSSPTNRITELKTTVQSLHDDGLRVVMDVVYNHVFEAGASSFQALVPGYYFRFNADGSYGNATGVGNEVASERPMVRKFIVESVRYWASQYHLDGFRFDLMGTMDVTTMQQIRAALDGIDPSIIVLGEGWQMGNLLPDSEKANQPNATKLPRIAQFNDGLRDGIKGSVFGTDAVGYVQGLLSSKTAVQAGIVGNTKYASGIGGSWGAIEPGQSVAYVEAHDNLTLRDKVDATMGSLPAATRARVIRLASSIALLAQGMPFMQAGQEFLRSKGGDDNSYKSPDSVNSLKWSQRSANLTTVRYFTGLLALRKAHPVFRMTTAAAIKANLKFLAAPAGVIGYTLNGAAVGDSWKQTVVAHNPNAGSVRITLPMKANWQVVVSGSNAGVKTLQVLKATRTLLLPGRSTMVLHG